MSYSIDLGKCVLAFIATAGSKASAEQTFGLSRRTLYNCLAAEASFSYEKPGSKGPRSIDAEALRQPVADFPDHTLAEHAKHFGASEQGIFYALKKRNIPRKKRCLPTRHNVP